jgi:hypothetical protein
MAAARIEIRIHASTEDVWAALRDWPALHQRLVPGFGSTPGSTARTASLPSPGPLCGRF